MSTPDIELVDEEALREALGVIVRRERYARELSGDAVARVLDCDRQNIFQLERGVQGFTVARLVNLGIVLKFSPSRALKEALDSVRSSRWSTNGTKRGARASRPRT